MKASLVASLAFCCSSALGQAQLGTWGQPFDFGNDPNGDDAIEAIHLIHLHTGKMIAITHAIQDLNIPCDPNCVAPSGLDCVGKVYL